jgi:dTDP-4-dehydrorhamnose 3,5-epimerase-like enzyme
MPVETPVLITGNKHVDERGIIGFINTFDMKEVRRFYRICNNDTQLKRGWRAHKIEQRWFSVLSGAFNVALIKIDDWENPSKNLLPQKYRLTNDNSVLHVPRGYATCIKAIEPNSEIILFADSLIENAEKDNYLFPVDYFDIDFNT